MTIDLVVMMVQIQDDTELFKLLIAASKKAMERDYFEAAYHALTAALHCAQSMKDSDRLEEVATEARHQLTYINATAQDNVMSSFAAAQRPSGVDMYRLLAKNAAVRAQMMRDNERRDGSAS